MLNANPSTILIVDDHPTNLKMLYSFLQESGYKVLVAKTGESALDKLQKILPDLILLDVMMPGMDGFETCRRLKALPETQDIPVIFMTALSEAADKVKGFKFGAVDYITKPFQQEEVLARIENQIKIRNLQTQLEKQNQQLQQEIKTRQKIEEQLQLVVQAANDGFWDWNIETGEVYISPRCKEMIGYFDEELPNEVATWENLVFPDDRISTLQLIENYNTGVVPRFECTQRFRHKNGSIVYILSRALHLKDESGQVVRMVGAHTDVTATIEATEALQQSQSLLAGVLNSSLDGVAAFEAIRDSEGKIADFKWILLNPAAKKMMGRRAKNLVGKQLLVEMPEICEIGLFEKYVSVVETGKPLETELYYSHGNTHLWMQLAAVKLRDGLAVTVRDITERKQAQEELLLARKRLEYLVSSNPSIIYSCRTTDPYGATFISENISTLFGYEPHEFLEDERFWDSKIHPDDRERVFTELSQLFAVGHHGHEYRFLHKNGTYRWVLDTLKLVRDEDGNPIEIVGSMSDITQRKQIEAKLQESQRWLQAMAEANPNIFYVYDLVEQQNIYTNREIYEVLGYRPEEIQQMGSMFLSKLMRPNHAVQLSDHLKQFETSKPGEVFEFEYRMRHKNGEWRWLLSRDTVFARTADGKVKQILGTATDISDRKRAEEALQASEAELRSLFAAMRDLVMVFNAEGRYLKVAQTNPALLYQPADVLLGKTLHEVFPSSQANLFLNSIQKTLETREPQDLEYSLIIAENPVWFSAKVSPLSPDSVIFVARDISDRKRTEEALQQSEARLQKLAASVPGMLYVFVRQIDGSYRYSYVSSGCREITELEPEQLLEDVSLAFALVHPDDLQSLIESIDISAQTLDPWMWEGRMTTRSGKTKWIQGAARPEKQANGEILWHGLVIDVSDRKQVELEIQTAKAALEQQIQRVLLQERINQEIRSSLNPMQIFQTAATQIGQAFGVNRCLIHSYIEDPTPQIPFVAQYAQPGIETVPCPEIPLIGNPHAQLILSQDRAIASDNIYTDPLLKAAAAICQQLGLKSMLAVRTSYQGKPNGIIGIHQYDRFRYWTQEEIELIEAVAAQLGIAIAQANLLEQEKQQRRKLILQNHALEKAKLEAEAANRAKSQFLSKMSHELRTPLNAILGFTQLMARDETLRREQKEHLGIINSSGEHLLDLINDILSMSKIEAGQVTLNETRFDLYQLLDSLEEMLRLKASSKGLQLICERNPDVPRYVQTDESKLRQVLINLLGNAIKFTRTGSVTLRVGLGNKDWEIGVGEQDRDASKSLKNLSTSSQLPITNRQILIFEVEDTGPGIAPEELSSLFDPFVQTQIGRQFPEGTGLGLSISQQFVRIMGGHITVSSTLNQGATFTFDIQVGLVPSAQEKPISSKRRIIGLEPNQPSYRILVVEDAAVNRKLMVKILESLGFEVRTATNGEEGIALWESWSPHLIWMDIVMPVMDGYEATRHIKQTPKGQNTVIIALTASAFEEQQEAILQAGCDDILPKPFQQEILLERIADHLGVRYVYEVQQPAQAPQSPNPQETLTSKALAVMPASWVTQLHQAALYADEELMNQLIEQIPPEHGSLRQALKGLIDNFRLEQLINLTELAGS